jgi:transcriptional regulator with XRE-family HTH domain
MEKTDKEIEDILGKSLKTVGTNLKRLRLTGGTDIEVLAKEVHIKAKVLEEIEEGIYEIRVSQLEQLCTYYGITPVELFKYSEA